MTAAQQKKPTPAQLRWLEQIARGRVTRPGHTWVNGLESNAGHPIRTNYVMTCALHDAGWIDQLATMDGYRYRIVLTDSGRAALAGQVPPVLSEVQRAILGNLSRGLAAHTNLLPELLSGFKLTDALVAMQRYGWLTYTAKPRLTDEGRRMLGRIFTGAA